MKQADDADKAELAALIEAETKDLRERIARLRAAQAAAKARKPFVIPTLTTPAQPTTHGAPLEQKSVEVPIGKYAKAEPVGNPEKLPATVKPEQSEPDIPADTGGDGKAEQPATAKLFPGASQAFLARIEKDEEAGKPIVVVRGAFVPDAEYTLYEKGYRTHLSKNWKAIQSEVSGSDPVRMPDVQRV